MTCFRVNLYAGSIFVGLYFGWWLLSSLTYVTCFTNFCVLGTLLVVAWTVAHKLFDHFNTETVKSNNKIVLITGCDTGFGNQLARRLDSSGECGVDECGATNLSDRIFSW